jgi:hypothetical protein
MKLLFAILTSALCIATLHAQTLKSLMYNTTNGHVAYGGTNTLNFTSAVTISNPTISALSAGALLLGAGSGGQLVSRPISSIPGTTYFIGNVGGTITNWTAPTTRTNLGLGAESSVTFDEVTANNTDFQTMTSGNISTLGNIVISNQSATNNGILFIYRTNNEPFLGLANLIASNNTTISNETLFRVGTAEATNRAAQFGFRSTNTNGSGVAVFSVFGFNALMMVGADASTNAVIFSGGGTNNEVMTLIRDGATEFARPIRFSTNASTRPSTNAPANTTNAAAWVEMRIGTNSYRVPLYQ